MSSGSAVDALVGHQRHRAARGATVALTTAVLQDVGAVRRRARRGRPPARLRRGSACTYGIPPANETTSGRDATANSARTSEADMPAARSRVQVDESIDGELGHGKAQSLASARGPLPGEAVAGDGEHAGRASRRDLRRCAVAHDVGVARGVGAYSSSRVRSMVAAERAVARPRVGPRRASNDGAADHDGARTSRPSSLETTADRSFDARRARRARLRRGSACDPRSVDHPLFARERDPEPPRDPRTRGAQHAERRDVADGVITRRSAVVVELADLVAASPSLVVEEPREERALRRR